MALLKYNCAECGAEILTTSYDNLKHKHGNLVFCCTEHFNSYFLRKDCERVRAENNKRLNAIKAEWDERATQAQKEVDDFYANEARIAKEKYEQSHKDTVSADGVLYSPDRLKLVEVPKDTKTFEVPEGITEISYKAFSDCENLTSVTLPDTLKIIDREAFLNCKNLTSITIPSSVTKVGDGAFANCKSLKDLIISEGVSELGGYCFKWCSSLESVTIPKSIKKICYGKNAGDGFGDSGIEGVFKGCKSLSTVTLPEGLEEIPAGMFESCSALKTISIPETVTKIGEYAFYFSGLEAIIIPASVTYIEDRAFQMCEKLQSVQYLGEEPSLGDYVFLWSGIEKLQEEREEKKKKKKNLILCPFRNLIFFKYDSDETVWWPFNAILWFFVFGIPEFSILIRIICSLIVSYLSKTILDMLIYKGDLDPYHHEKPWNRIHVLLRLIPPLVIIILHKFFDFF